MIVDCILLKAPCADFEGRLDDYMALLFLADTEF